MPYLSYISTRTPSIYLHSALPVPPNNTRSHCIASQSIPVPPIHTHSQYIHSQCPTCPTKSHAPHYINSQHPTCTTQPHALPLYNFITPYLSLKNYTHYYYIHSECPTCRTNPQALPKCTFIMPYMSDQSTRTPNIYIHSTLPVPPNHTHSQYTHSQCFTCSTKPQALSIYKFSVPYLYQISTCTPSIYLHSTLPVPPNHTHSQYTHSQCLTCSTKPQALSLYKFSVPYLSQISTSTPSIYLHSTLPVPPNRMHSQYTHSQCLTCSTKPQALSLYKFSVPYLSQISTRTPSIYLHSTLPVTRNNTLSHHTFTVNDLSHQTTSTPPIYVHKALFVQQITRTPTIHLDIALPVPPNHTHSPYTPSQCHTCPIKPHTLSLYTFTKPYLSIQTTRTSTIYFHFTLPVPPNHTHCHYIP